MSELFDLTAQLSARLPELERQLSKLGNSFHMRYLPKGLFREALSFDACILEIKRDIAEVQRNLSPQVTTYLVSQISQKITVLVHFCQLYGAKKVQKNTFSFESISTRSQWLEQRNSAHNKLMMQKNALVLRLESLTSASDVAVVLALRAELGDIERELSALMAGS